MTEIRLPAREVQVGDIIVVVPPLSDTLNGNGLGLVTMRDAQSGVIALWTVDPRGQWRPADIVLNHSDPVVVEREEV